MKNIIFILAAGMLLAGCADELTESSKGEDVLSISASKNELLLDERSHAETALKLTWSTGTNYGTSNAISYTLEIAPEGTEYADGYTEELGRKAYTWSRTTQQLNDLLHTQMGAVPAEAVQYRARITAKVAADTRIQTSEVTFTITPYEPVTHTLYLIGGATPNSWSADDATPLKRTQAGIFTWTGMLKAGDFKFITILGEFSPSYSKDPSVADGMSLIYNGADDAKFVIDADKAGGYTVKADLLNLRITITPADINTPPFSKIYFVSEANSWAFIPLTQDPTNPFIFRYGAVINKGQFKFGTTQGAWDNMYKTTSDNAPYTTKEVVFVAGSDPDNKWFLSDDEGGKPYKIALDITPDKESMVMAPFTSFAQIWMIGDATPNGWSLDDATPFTKIDDYTFTWTGTLTAGSMKLTCDKDSSWNGAWFMPTEDNKELTTGSEILSFVNKKLPENGSVDRKWAVTAGHYTLLLNQLTETMTITQN